MPGCLLRKEWYALHSKKLTLNLFFIMTKVTKPIMLNETGERIVQALGLINGSLQKKAIQNVTYSLLKSLRDNDELQEGMFYRITDYITTTSVAGTQSAGHQFDLIVTALASNCLSEDAWAILHDGDTYFQNCKLQAWKRRYHNN